jgi:hypothetical protein
MNNLRDRTSTRAISRSNAKRALDRICRELRTLISDSPNADAMPITASNAKVEVHNMREAIEALYIHTKT